MSKLLDNFDHEDPEQVTAVYNHARALEEMLRKHGIDDVQWCRECEEFGGHAPDCALAKLLD